MLAKMVAAKLSEIQKIKMDVKVPYVKFLEEYSKASIPGKIKLVVKNFKLVVNEIKWWIGLAVAIMTIPTIALVYWNNVRYTFDPEARLAEDFDKNKIALIDVKQKLKQNELTMATLLEVERFKKLSILEVYRGCYTGDDDDLTRKVFLKIFENPGLEGVMRRIWDVLQGKSLPRINIKNYEEYIIIKYFIMGELSLSSSEELDFRDNNPYVESFIDELDDLRDGKSTPARVVLQNDGLRPLLDPTVGSINPGFDGSLAP